jgi:hypothetical protein
MAVLLNYIFSNINNYKKINKRNIYIKYIYLWIFKFWDLI